VFGGRLSPDGRKGLCLFSRPQREQSGLFVLDIKSRKSLRGEEQPLNGVILNYCYCWSPDAKRIAYAWVQVHEKEAANQETESHLVVADADGEHQVTIASKKGNNRSGVFTIGSVDWR
jgi:Tol biopolymer transport system component